MDVPRASRPRRRRAGAPARQPPGTAGLHSLCLSLTSHAVCGIEKFAACGWGCAGFDSLSGFWWWTANNFFAWRLGLWGLSDRPADRGICRRVPLRDSRPVGLREVFGIAIIARDSD